MLKSRSLMGALLVATLILTGAAFAAAASSSSSDGSQSSAASIKTVLRSDLTLKSVLVMPESSQPASGKPEQTAVFRTCRCSCGQRCTTNADCGPGGACAVGITCCNRTPGKNGLNAIFAQKDEMSSGKNPSIAALAVTCTP